ncbi:MAG: hypothetical protein ACRDPY_08430 [Streptosporangiaceae bacterium]
MANIGPAYSFYFGFAGIATRAWATGSARSSPTNNRVLRPAKSAVHVCHA